MSPRKPRPKQHPVNVSFGFGVETGAEVAAVPASSPVERVTGLTADTSMPVQADGVATPEIKLLPDQVRILRWLQELADGGQTIDRPKAFKEACARLGWSKPQSPAFDTIFDMVPWVHHGKRKEGKNRGGRPPGSKDRKTRKLRPSS